MDIVITRGTLLNVAGIAFLTAIVLQLLVKPWLTKLYGDKPWHDIAMNVIATLLAVVLAIVGRYIAEAVGDGPSTAFAVVQGLVAAFLAVYGYEAAKNVKKFVSFNGDNVSGDKVGDDGVTIGEVKGGNVNIN